MRHHRSAAKPTLTPGVSRKTWVILAATLLTGITLSLMVGASGFGLPGDATARVLIFYEIRLPRTALAVLIGAALATSGAALQGYLRNPLAEPGLIGITGGAALGAVLAIQLGLASTFALALPFGGLTGAAVAVVVVMTLAGTRAGALTLILAGIAVSTVAAALTALVLNLSANPFAAVEMVFWMMGSLANRSTTHVWLAGPPIILGLACLFATARALDALSLGEDAARSLGLEPRITQALLIIGTALAVGAATSVAGTIGFVGLVVPHLLRPFARHRPSQLLPLAGIGGAILVVYADVVLRLASPSGALRLGVFTALLGAPLFLWLVHKTRSALTP